MNAITARFELTYGDFTLAVDLQLPNTGVTVLFGASGSGKTTLLRCIAGLQKAPLGYLQINDLLWQDSTQNLFLPTHQRNLGYVFQEANLFPHLTVKENLNFGLKRQRQAHKPTEFKDLLELLGIEHLLKRLPERLSGGERQRVAIARALVLKPDILLMDEPLAALDFKRKQEILPFLTRLHQQLAIPVLYVTHSQQEVAQLADTLVIMEQGRVLATGDVADTLTRLDMPFSKDKEASTVWHVTLIEHETEYHLSRVTTTGGVLNLPYIEAPLGTALRIQIYARDVSIALAPPQASSILNILPATILALTPEMPGQCVVQLRIGSDTLLAHITQKSAHLLGLKPDMTVYVQIKGTSLLN